MDRYQAFILRSALPNDDASGMGNHAWPRDKIFFFSRLTSWCSHVLFPEIIDSIQSLIVKVASSDETLGMATSYEYTLTLTPGQPHAVATAETIYVRAAPLVRVKVKFIVKPAVCETRRQRLAAFLTVNLALTCTSGAGQSGAMT